MDIDRMIQRALRPLLRRLEAMIDRGWITRTDQGAMQRLQVGLSDTDMKDAVEHFEPYGFTSHPHPESEALVVFPGADRRHGVVVVVADRRYRLAVEAGEVALHDDLGQRVHLRRTGIEVSTPLDVRIEGENIALHAKKSWSWDVDGYGQRLTSQGGGSYQLHTWQAGAVMLPDPVDTIHPPEGPP